MGHEEAPTRASGRRLKFGSRRSGKAEVPATPSQSQPSPIAIGERLAAAYIVVARTALLGFQALQDRRAERRLAALRGAAQSGPRPARRSSAAASAASIKQSDLP